MTVKRYTPTQCCEHDGTYVTYSDYQKLVAERDDFKKSAEYSAATNKKIVATNMRLSDENTELKSDAAIAEIKSEEAQNMYESILDNPSVYDMESLVDCLESYAENKKSFAANLRAERKG